tara:strand:- start:1265 stop:1702 length:438 start_codon:yes stop_codon:yes gene_type:complete
MPICPKCGKCFSSEQALTYHLNKKYKCGTWKCGKCNTMFDTQFALKIHKMHCEQDKSSYIPSYDILCNIYNSDNLLFIEKDNSNIIHSISPAYLKLLGTTENIIGSPDTSQILDDNLIHRSNIHGDSLKFHRVPISNTMFLDIPV